MNEQLQNEIEEMLRDGNPDVEVVLAERAGPGLVRVVIDHPDGVDIDLCERVSR
jgi:ribosome maturation factor RimP